MIFGSIVAIIFTMCGILYGLENLIMLTKCALSQRVPATIIAYRGINSIYIFIYHVFVAPGVVLRLERKVMPLMNFIPFYSINNYVGRNVTVPFNPKKQKLLPHEPMLIVNFILSLMSAVLGIGMIIVLDRLQH